jgi:uncharacterized membrane protein
MSLTAQIALLWAAFALTHLGLSSLRLRPRLVSALGEWRFRGVYSGIALGLFVPLVSIYLGGKHAGTWIYQLPRGPALRWLVYVGMALAFVLLVGGIAQPSPAGMVARGDADDAGHGTGARRDPEVRGALRITRHPVLMAMWLFGLVHLLPNGRTTDLAFFGGFALFVPIGCWHQDRRKLAERGEPYRAFLARTSFFPLPSRDALRGLWELPWLAVALGLALTVVVRHFHASWFS